ncbi:MAG TPA: hypothetical protein VIM12_16190 [Noviherbaspirillum sp.]|jgi:hypothetical protein|uniref:hypothetical protein n=1 Tax=Noviherbaspirillum sp. TaxID=1926288 RepID=UPI002F9292BC
MSQLAPDLPARARPRLLPAMLLLPVLLLPALGAARTPSPAECREAGDFIGNAALARDRGISEAQFLRKIREDVELIKAFPPQLRWFVQDEEDAQFLMEAALDVFQKPRSPDEHRQVFIVSCLSKAGGKPRLDL